MLDYLRISNLAIIDRVDVDFRSGLNVLTGETGAGKSILIGALNLLLGSRASAELIRKGEEEAHVEGLFHLEEGFEPDDELAEFVRPGTEITLTRRIFRSGRSRAFINGNLATVEMLQSVGRSLISIFGQHEHYVLLNPEEHLDILDGYGGLWEARRRTALTHGAWRQAQRDLATAEKHVRELERLAEENAAAVEELTNAEIREGEEDELIAERDTLGKAVQIRERAFEAYQTLYSKSGSIVEMMSEVGKAVDFLVSVNPKLSNIKENLEDALYRVEDVALELRDTAEHSHSDPARLERIEERLALLRRLKRKYGRDVDGLVRYVDELGREHGEILTARAEVKKLSARSDETYREYMQAAEGLSKERRRAAGKLEKAVEGELKELAMPGAEFSVRFDHLEGDTASPLGLEKVEFYLCANPGEELRPLAKVASGGELSRIMLSLKALQVHTGGAPTVVFDEVDAGIGGHTATAVGARLARVAEAQQVLCVTHLHQIAARADHHLSVGKRVAKGRTRIDVQPLDREGRINELARMLGAEPGSESAKEHVRRLMEVESAEVSG